MPIHKREGKRGKSFYFTVTVDGVRYRGAIKTARTTAQAKEAERKIIAEIHAGTYGRPKGNAYFKDFAMKVYLPWAKFNKRSWKIDESRLKPIIAFFGKYRLREVSPFRVESFKQKRFETPIVYKKSKKNGSIVVTEKPRSIAATNRELLLLSRIFRLAVTRKEVAENPCREVALLKGERSRERYLLPDEEERLFAQLTGPREHLRAFVILAINTGMRESELFKLKPDDVDFFRDLIYVRDTKNVRKTKDTEDRKVPMNDAVRELLGKLVAEARKKGYDYVITNPETGKRYTTIKTAWYTACRLAKITDFRFHDLRHTFCTRASDEGVPLTAIKEVMGHKSIETTLRYSHATNAGMRRAVEAVGKRGQKLVKNEGRHTDVKVVNN